MDYSSEDRPRECPAVFHMAGAAKAAPAPAAEPGSDHANPEVESSMSTPAALGVVERATVDAARCSVLAAHGETVRRVMGYLLQRENAALLVCRGAQSAAGRSVPAAEVFGLRQLALQAIVAAAAAAGSHGCGVRPLLLGGDDGSGKSTVLAHAAHTCAATIPVARVIHQVATGHTLHTTLTRLWLALDSSSVPPLAEQELCAAMPAMLARAATRLQPVLIFLDGVDQQLHGSVPGLPWDRAGRVSDGLRRALRWVPSPLPAGVRLVCTVSTDCPGWDTLSCEQVVDEHVLTWPPPEETAAVADSDRKWVVGSVAPLPVDASLSLMREWSRALGSDIDDPRKSRVDSAARLDALARRFSNPFRLRLELVRELRCSTSENVVPEGAEEAVASVLRHFEVRVGTDSARGCVQLLRLACAGGLEEAEIASVLARRGVQVIGDSRESRPEQIFIPELELLLDSVQSSGNPAERWRLSNNCIVQAAAQARYGHTDSPEAISWLTALAEHLQIATKSNTKDRATRLLPVLHMLALHATKRGQHEAIAQAHDALRAAAFDPSLVCWLLERGQTEALLQYCLSSEGYGAVCEHVLSLPPPLAEYLVDTSESILNLGRLLSTAGQYLPARQLLQGAIGRQAAGSEASAEMRGRLQLAVAENEVRYWDSRRDWKSERDLELLLSSSTESVTLLRRADEFLRSQKIFPAAGVRGSACSASTTTLRLCDALTRCANAHFKAGCVLTGEAASRHFDLSDTMTGEVERLIGTNSRFEPTETLAGAWLVSGVTTSCRAHLLKREIDTQEMVPEVATLLNRAVELFLRAESMLVQCVGEFNEKSIYTHSNLGEIYVYDLHNLRQGLVHLRQSCNVATRIFGDHHPSTQAKHRQIQSITDQLRQMPQQLQQLLGLDVHPGGVGEQ